MHEKVNLLIVDDQRDLCETIKDIFQEIGYDVDIVSTGKKALAQGEHRFFHIAFIDIILPDMDGLEVLRKIKQCSPLTEGIIITGNPSLNNAIKALDNGAFAYLMKPFEFDEVRAVVKKALEKQHIVMENLLLKEFSENIVAYIPSGLLVLNKDFSVVMANRSYCEIFLTTKEETEGKHVNDVLPVKELETHLKKVKDIHKPIDWLEFRCNPSRTAEKVLHISISEIPLPKLTEGEIGLLLVVQDFTQRKQLEDELIQSQKMAELGETATRWAHEIRNPLQQIRTCVQYFQKYSPIDEEERISLNGIMDGSTSLNRIVSELLGYTKPMELTYYQVDIHILIDGVLFEFSENFKKSNVKVRKDYCKISRRISVDGFKIKHAFQNIVKNALDAMPHGGEITVATTIKKKEGIKNSPEILEVRISDTGCGMIKEELDKIFQPFFTTKEKGIGLGMSVAKNVIDVHGGEMSVESKLGEGTQVIIRLVIR